MHTRLSYTIATIISLALVIGSLSQRLPMDITEVLGFISGALCVWLTVSENIWNWPIGIANNVFFLILFLQSRLFADMGLQVVYIVLGGLGWYWWLRGGPQKATLPVTRITPFSSTMLGLILLLATGVLTIALQRIADSAPFWDALTTVLSLIAQYMLTRKLLENWYVWLVADVIYVALYCYKQLYLTAGLYALFIVLCLAGLAHWRASLAVRSRPVAEGLLEVAHV